MVLLLARKAKQAIRGWSMQPDAAQKENKLFECSFILLGALSLISVKSPPRLLPVLICPKLDDGGSAFQARPTSETDVSDFLGPSNDPSGVEISSSIC